MTQEEKLELIRELQMGGIHVGRDFIMEMSGDINNYENIDEETGETSNVGLSTLVKAVEQVQSYFWGASSIAVVFCVCRDCYGYPDNMSQFEREFDCTPGTLSGTFRNNEFMKLPISKWEANGAKERVLKLMKAYQKAVMKVMQEAEPAE